MQIKHAVNRKMFWLEYDVGRGSHYLRGSRENEVGSFHGRHYEETPFHFASLMDDPDEIRDVWKSLFLEVVNKPARSGKEK